MRAGISVDLLTEKQVKEDFDTTVKKASKNYEARLDDMRDRAIAKSDEQRALSAEGFDQTFARVDQDASSQSGFTMDLIRERQEKNQENKQSKQPLGIEVGVKNREKIVKRQRENFESEAVPAQQNTGASNLADKPPLRITAFLENDPSRTKGPNVSLYGNDLTEVPEFVPARDVRQLQAGVVGEMIRGVDDVRHAGERFPSFEDRVAFKILEKLTSPWTHVFVGLFHNHMELAISDSRPELDSVISKFPSGGSGQIAT